MANYQLITEEIQAALSATIALDWDLLRDCAAEYAAACEELNARLAHCDELLKRGLRSEAIQQAERLPNLLDSVAQLDFPEREQWLQLLSANGMVLPMPLRMEIAADLNAAYAAEAPLLSLLKSHRILALARAPLLPRIKILRSIHKLDPDNSLWMDDLKLFETHRLQEIRKEAEQASNQQDAAGIAVIEKELQSAGWIVSPQSDLLEYVRQSRQQIVANKSHAELLVIERELTQAYADYDIPTARILREKWQSLLPLSLLRSDHALVQRARPALDWLDQQDASTARQQQHAAALHALELALDNEATQHKLERLMLALQKYEEEIPQALVMRYNERIRYLETIAARKFTLRVAGLCGILCIVAGITAWLFIRHQREQQVATAQIALTELVRDQRFEEAQSYLLQLGTKTPFVVDRAEIQKLKAELESFVANEKQRGERFQQVMQQVENDGVEKFSASDFQQAKELAKTAAEKNQIADWESSVSKHQTQIRLERETKFREDVEQLLQQIVKLETIPDGAFQDTMESVKAKLIELNNRKILVGVELASQMNPLNVRIAALERRHAERLKQAAAYQGITAAVGDPRLFRLRLEEYGSKFPDTSAALDIKQVVAESDLWEDLEAWRSFYKQKAFGDLPRISPQAAMRVIDEAKPLLEAHPAKGLAESWLSKAKYLELIAARESIKLGPLKELFDDRLLTQVHFVKTITGERYYTEKTVTVEQFKDNLPYRLKYYAGFDFSTKIKDLKKEEFKDSGVAPQVELSKKLRRALDSVESGKWESGFFDILTQITNDSLDVDPILRLVLLKHSLETAQRGSYPLQVAYADLSPGLMNHSDLKANWLDPTVEEAILSRVRAYDYLAKFSDQEKLRARAKEAFTQQTEPIPPLPDWYGWIMKEGTEPQVVSVANAANGNLLVLLNDEVSGAKWQSVGQLQAGKVALDSKIPAALMTGRPVFITGEQK